MFSYPQTKEAMTVGIPDTYLGESIKSFIVPKDNEVIDINELKHFVLDRLGDFKCPNEFKIVDDIPKGPSGKLLRRKLREMDK
ncbi:hypothetical protein MTBBW1_2510011 [Desulfamplus magnetovallimortis]|uniref:AMP-binding enzyme C-terminal domain-containing protein n=1 Tax=Desulfamplus magnetovallimortis TaxID=1246637 RepID=A0A1W1HEN6_9BACT|nr:hypothetical protein MTBBW1_2510011 [Desulfamplus magnetovallimortis]